MFFGQLGSATCASHTILLWVSQAQRRLHFFRGSIVSRCTPQIRKKSRYASFSASFCGKVHIRHPKTTKYVKVLYGKLCRSVRPLLSKAYALPSDVAFRKISRKRVFWARFIRRILLQHSQKAVPCLVKRSAPSWNPGEHCICRWYDFQKRAAHNLCNSVRLSKAGRLSHKDSSMHWYYVRECKSTGKRKEASNLFRQV